MCILIRVCLQHFWTNLQGVHRSVNSYRISKCALNSELVVTMLQVYVYVYICRSMYIFSYSYSIYTCYVYMKMFIGMDFIYMCVYLCTSKKRCTLPSSYGIWIQSRYGVATISRRLKIIGLFCRIWSLLWALLQKRPIIVRSLLIIATP